MCSCVHGDRLIERMVVGVCEQVLNQCVGLANFFLHADDKYDPAYQRWKRAQAASADDNAVSTSVSEPFAAVVKKMWGGAHTTVVPNALKTAVGA